MPHVSLGGIRRLLVATAVMEAGTGLALVAVPSRVAGFLLGASLDAPASVIVARVAGVALAALGLACWLGRHDGGSRAARGLVGAMLLYNVCVALVLVHGATRLAPVGVGLWPTALLHTAMGGWYLAVSRRP